MRTFFRLLAWRMCLCKEEKKSRNVKIHDPFCIIPRATEIDFIFGSRYFFFFWHCMLHGTIDRDIGEGATRIESKKRCKIKYAELPNQSEYEKMQSKRYFDQCFIFIFGSRVFECKKRNCSRTQKMNRRMRNFFRFFKFLCICLKPSIICITKENFYFDIRPLVEFNVSVFAPQIQS